MFVYISYNRVFNTDMYTETYYIILSDPHVLNFEVY